MPWREGKSSARPECKIAQLRRRASECALCHNADVRQDRTVQSVEFRCNSPRQWNAWVGVRSSTEWRVTEIEFLVDPCLCILETQRLTTVSKLWEM